MSQSSRQKIFAIACVLLALPGFVSAHGFIPDGHPTQLTIVDYLELGGIVIASIGLLAFSFFGKDRKSNHSDDKK